MTREHLIEDIQNVLQMSREGGSPERLRQAFEGLYRHIRAERDAPERVCSCLEESVRVLSLADGPIDEGRWDYARTCLEAALDFVRAEDPPAATARGSAPPSS
jgi:hypothetical protein